MRMRQATPRGFVLARNAIAFSFRLPSNAADRQSLPPVMHAAPCRRFAPFDPHVQRTILRGWNNSASGAGTNIAGASSRTHNPSTSMITPECPWQILAARPSTTLKNGPSRTTGPNACRSRRPRSTCSRPGSAICSTNYSGRAVTRRPLLACLDSAAGGARCLHPRPAQTGRGLLPGARLPVG